MKKVNMEKKRCFAMSKTSPWTRPEDRKKADNEPSCYALQHPDFVNMYAMGYCGTSQCPWFKEAGEVL